MGLFSDLKAMNDLQQIKHGGVGKLSLSQITCFIVNMSDAKKNLSAKEYDAIYGLQKAAEVYDKDGNGYERIYRYSCRDNQNV